ncbi:MAG: hypothetical protein ABGW78_03180, partial [Pirellulales bacterium]
MESPRILPAIMPNQMKGLVDTSDHIILNPTQGLFINRNTTNLTLPHNLEYIHNLITGEEIQKLICLLNKKKFLRTGNAEQKKKWVRSWKQ